MKKEGTQEFAEAGGFKIYALRDQLEGQARLRSGLSQHNGQERRAYDLSPDIKE